MHAVGNLGRKNKSCKNNLFFTKAEI